MNSKQNNTTNENPAFDDINSPIPVHKNPPNPPVQAAPIVATTQRYNEGQTLNVPNSDFYSPPGMIDRSVLETDSLTEDYFVFLKAERRLLVSRNQPNN